MIWNSLGKWAASLPKGTPLYVEGELVYEKYPRKVEATLGKKTVEVEVSTSVAKIKVDRLIRLAPGAGDGNGTADSDEADL